MASGPLRINAFKERVGLMSAYIAAGNNSVIRSSLKEMSDARLVSAAKSGEAFAFFELSRRHSNKILWQAYRIVKNRQDAEDVRQESLMKAFIHLKDFEERASFSSWLTRIAINSALMSVRKKRGHIETSLDVTNDGHESMYRWEPKDPAESPESRCARREREALLKGADCATSAYFGASGQVEACACENDIAHLTGGRKVEAACLGWILRMQL